MRVRLTRTMVKEYELNPEYYDPSMTPEQMAESDTNADDREMLFDDCISDEVKWEIIKDPA